METTGKNSDFDSTNILLFFIRWWKHLAIISIIAAVLAVIFSTPFFITPLYESTVLMFPAKSTSLSRALYGSNVDFLEYGEVEDAERLLQVLGSNALRDRVIEKFDLYNHYEIEPDAKYRKTTIRRMFSELISSRRTTYGAVEIKVRDRDPEFAAEIANAMAAISDSIQNEIRNDRAEMAYNVAVKRYEELMDEIIETEDSLRSIMRSGVYEFNAQSEMLFRQLAKDISAHNESGRRAIEEELGIISEQGSKFLTYRIHLDQITRNISIIQRIMQEAKVDMDNFIPFKFLIDEAFVTEKKVYPVRWLIVFIATFAAAFLGTITLMTYDNLVARGIIKK